MVGIGLGVALLLNHPYGRSGLFRILLVVPWALAPVANAVLWKWILHANYGVLNGVLKSLGIIDHYQVWLGTPLSALNFLLIVDVWKSVPFIALLMLAGLQRVPTVLYRAAYIDGAGPLAELPPRHAADHSQRYRHRHRAADHLVAARLRSRLRPDARRPGRRHRAAQLPCLPGHLQLPRSRLRLGDRQRHLRASPSCWRPLCAGCCGRASRSALDELLRAPRGGPSFQPSPCLGLAVFTVWSLAPLVWLILSSMLRAKGTDCPAARPFPGQPDDRELRHASSARRQRWRAACSTRSLVALFSTAVALALGAPAAYALARLTVPQANAIAFLILATQMLPGIAIAIPLFIAISALGLIDSVWSLGIVYLSFNLPVVVWILRGFFLGIPAGISRRRRRSTGPASLPPSGISSCRSRAAAHRRRGVCLYRSVERVLLRADPYAPAGPDRAVGDRPVRRPV